MQNYEKGDQPILKRKKNIREDINEKVVENNASLITEFKVSYEFGSSVMYVQRSKKQVPESDADQDDNRISALNSMLHEEKKTAEDIKLATDFKICGIGYRIIRPKRKIKHESVFDIKTLSPLTTFVVYSNDIYQEPKLGVTYKIKKDGSKIFGAYTDDRYYEIGLGGEFGSYEILNSYKDGKGTPNVPNIIPIVEYVNNYDRQGCFEKVIPVLDAINVTNSDRVNDVAQHVQSLLWLHNCQLPEGYTIKSNGLIETTSPNGSTAQANIKYLEQPLDQTGVQTLVDYLQSKGMCITGTPERRENNGGSTGSAMSLSSGWQVAETLAQTSDAVFDESEMRSIEIMLEIIKATNEIPEEMKEIKNLKLSDIAIKHPRNKNFDLNTKVNALATMLNSGIDELNAIETICLFTDPQQVYQNSKDNIRKMRENGSLSPKNANNNKDTNNPTDAKDVDKDRTLQDTSDQRNKSHYTI